jgi:uncharacterized membrane protein (DUF373 family)
MTDRTTDNHFSYRAFILNNEWHSRITGFLVGILMIGIYLWVFAGFINLLLNLYHSFLNNWSHGAEMMIKQTVIILASLELIRTFKSYLIIGRVKVTFILDVALVVQIGELISLWYRDYSTIEVIVSVFVISILVLLRIITTRFSPDIDTDINDPVNR